MHICCMCLWFASGALERMPIALYSTIVMGTYGHELVSQVATQLDKQTLYQKIKGDESADEDDSENEGLLHQ